MCASLTPDYISALAAAGVDLNDNEERLNRLSDQINDAYVPDDDVDLARPGRPAVAPDSAIRYVVLGPNGHTDYDQAVRYAWFEDRTDADAWLATKDDRYSLHVERVDTWPLRPVDEVAS